MVYRVSSPYYNKVWYFRNKISIANELYCSVKMITKFLSGENNIVKQMELNIDRLTNEDFINKYGDFSLVRGEKIGTRGGLDDSKTR